MNSRTNGASLCILLLSIVAVLSGCGRSRDQVSPAITTTSFGDRIGSLVPATIVFQGRTYIANDKILATAKVIPCDFGFLGAVTPPNGEPPVVVRPSNREGVFHEGN